MFYFGLGTLETVPQLQPEGAPVLGYVILTVIVLGIIGYFMEKKETHHWIARGIRTK